MAVKSWQYSCIDTWECKNFVAPASIQENTVGVQLSYILQAQAAVLRFMSLLL